MAHQVKTMAWAGAVPWHGLGNELQQGADIDTWIQSAGLDWEVKKSPVLFSANGTDMENYDGQYVIHRDGAEIIPFGFVGKQYRPVQPKEVLEFYRELTEEQGFTLETAGQLFNGEKIWALARCGDGFELAGGDKILPYLLLTTGFDGQTATVGKFTSIRVVCNNTLTASLNNKSEGRVSIGHRTQFQPDQMKQKLGVNVEVFANFENALQEMVNVKLTQADANTVINNVLGIDDESRGIDIATANFMSNMFATGNYQGSQLDSSKGTAFGLLNVVTEFYDHRKSHRNADQKLNNVWFGSDEKMKQVFAETLLAMA